MSENLVDTANDLSTVLDNAARLRNVVEAQAPDILNVLTRYESSSTAADELRRTLSCLTNITEEAQYLIHDSLVKTLFEEVLAI